MVICGKPNVGKSSILNSIVGRERAIVTPIPGTTRDVIEEHLIIDGYPLRFVDTAGIRESDDVIESLGIHKAREYLEMANIIVVIFDRSQNLQKEDFDLMEIVKNKTHIVVLNKSDLPAVLSSSHISELYSQEDIIEISALSGSGVSELLKKIVDLIRHNIHSEESMLAINTRQCEELVRSISSLHNALHSLQEGLTPDVVIFDIDDALRSLQRMNGENIDKKLLDTIFGSFCVGK
ncbi:MAG: GTP-binding protein [Candidatus Atribacteria bacterium]|nr:GTP-binding protein [Candidatus Atribacteria bacterium]